MDMGTSVPLMSPTPFDPSPRGAYGWTDGQYEQPRGKLLIYWGCGAKAGPGQPVVIDFATVGKNPQAPNLKEWAGMMTGLDVTPMQEPSADRFATYGEWPNARTRATVPSEGSLVGEHVVQGNYSPEIKFTLTPPLDFLGALNLTTNAKTPAGAAQLGWGAVRGAQAYLASAVGASQSSLAEQNTSSLGSAHTFPATEQ